MTLVTTIRRLADVKILQTEAGTFVILTRTHRLELCLLARTCRLLDLDSVWRQWQYGTNSRNASYNCFYPIASDVVQWCAIRRFCLVSSHATTKRLPIPLQLRPMLIHISLQFWDTAVVPIEFFRQTLTNKIQFNTDDATFKKTPQTRTLSQLQNAPPNKYVAKASANPWPAKI